MRSDLPSGTVTFLFTDVEGSTRLLHELGPERYGEALAEHRRSLREAIAAHGGVEVDTQGDAFFVAFPTATGAVDAASSAVRALADGPIRVRIGLHTGVAELAEEGYVGLDVHRAARIAALAHGGQIVVSPTTAALLDSESLRDLGTHRLKDFESPVRLSQLGEGDFPPLRTPGSVELPSPPTRFLGREQELFDAVSLVYERDPRVLTIVGAGGTGKTRFAIELARLLADEAEGGTVFVPLAPLRDADLVIAAIGERLGSVSPNPLAIAARVGGRRTHVVCDNLEHLLPAAAGPLAELAGAVAALRLLATSREALRVQGEVELDLPPLVHEEAVALFCERARAVRADLAATEAVDELCERLDRLPLALELAAARTKLLAPEKLLQRLGGRLDMLRGARDMDERHATMRATIAWSYDLLDADERRLFERLGVFRGGCTLETAEAVCEAELETFASLLDKSLLRRRWGQLGEERYWMLETIREFALERLESSGEAEVLRRRHAERMLEIAREAHLSEDDDEPFELQTALAERDDLRAALDWAAENDRELAVELVVSLETFWNAHAQEEGLRRVSALLEGSEQLPTELRARALRVYGNTAFNRDEETTYARWEESLALFRALRDERGVAAMLHRLALRPLEHGDLEEARRLVDESQSLSRGRFRLIETVNLAVYSRLALADGHLEEAIELMHRGVNMAKELGWAWWESGRRDDLSRLQVRRGHLDEAEREGRTALVIARDHENRLRTASAITALAQAALARGEHERAGLLWGAAESEWSRQARRTDEDEWLGGSLLTEQHPAFTAAYERGRRLELGDAVAIALGEVDPGHTVP